MNQVLHIFKKDAVRHWPEILISLVLLDLSTREELHPWQDSSVLSSFRPAFYNLASRWITPATILFWVFLTVRVVQDESLVGDRQWWVTKPYQWSNLLAAKLLFIFIFVSVPLFHVQLLLLHQFGFPILPSLPTLVLSQLSFYLVLFLPALFLASLTKNFGQFLLTVGGIVAVVVSIVCIASKFPSVDTKTPPAIVEVFQSTLLWGSFLVILVWQFARRRRWVSAAALLAMLGLNALISVAVPDAKTVEAKYARVAAQSAPAKIALLEPTKSDGWKITNLTLDPASTVNLSIPISVSGVAPGTMVMVDVMKITVDSAGDPEWTRDWKYQHVELWPEDRSTTFSYDMDRKEYEKIKASPENLHIELGLSEYQEADTRIVAIPAAKFVDETLGICRIEPGLGSYLQCLKPFQAPGLMATFDPKKFPCTKMNRSGLTPEDATSHAWEFANHDGFPAPHYSPISDYSIGFRAAALPTDLDSKPSQEFKSVILCPGSEIKLARPQLKCQIRILLDVPNVRLEDLVETGGE